MAALYLHNALHTPDTPSSSRTSPSPHYRNSSTVSSGTTFTRTSEYSHPTEPLLHAETSEAMAYRDMLSQQPTFGDTRRAADLSVDGGLATYSLKEKTSLWDRHIRRRYNWLKLMRGLLGILLGVWAIYNTIRYFLAFMQYNPTDGQALSLALGISTAVSFALLMCALILSVFQPYLLFHRVPLRTLLFTRKGFDTCSSFFLLAPAIYNLVMTFIWRNSTNPELDFQRRCHVDVDVVWSISKTQCSPRLWGTWLALSIVRLVLTLLVIIAYHIISYRIERPTNSSHQYHYRHRSQLSESQSSIPPSLATNLPSYDFPGPSRLPQHQSSDSTLNSRAHSKQSSSQQSPRGLRTHTSMSSLYSDDDTALEGEIIEYAAHPSQDQELNGFADRFRALISHITRETEVAVEFARRDSDENNLYMPPVPPAVGYDEFGRPYRPEEQVSFLNGYIRRMPTIESMGSREQGSPTTSKGITASRRSTATYSQPPTRSNTLTVSEHSAGSHAPSRGSSLSACENMSTGRGKTNEMGELVDRGSEEGYDASKGTAAMSGYTTSTSTMSYYTATSFGSAVRPASEDILPHPS